MLALRQHRRTDRLVAAGDDPVLFLWVECPATSVPGAAPYRCGTRPATRGERASCVPTGSPTTRHAALPADTAERRGRADPGHHRIGWPVWPVWISTHHHQAAGSGLASRQGPRGADLAPRGAEGAAEAEAAWPIVAQRRLLPPPAARAAQSRL